MKNFLTSTIKRTLEIKFNIKILFLEEYQDQNGYTEEDVYNRAFCCGNEIYLGKYDDPKIEMLCLFHELGHIVADEKKTNSIYFCKIAQESIAWETAIELLNEYSSLLNFTYDFDTNNSKEMEFMREQLKTYLDSEYNDLR